MSGIEIKVLTEPSASEVADALRRWPRAALDATRKSLKSTGFEGKKKLAGVIRTNEFGWTELHPFTVATHPGRKSPLRKLAQFTRYTVRGDGMAVKIKFDTAASPSFGGGNSNIISFIRRAEKGQTVPYSGKVQRKMARMGFLIRAGTAISVPKRPIFQPFFDKYSGHLQNHFTIKFKKWITQLVKK
jgi:hypothetical protein